MTLYVQIDGKVDTLMLWNLIEKYRLNLTAMDDKTWVYGKVNYTMAGEVISKCALFGDLKAEITQGGGRFEQEEKK
jgi:hypothetical protein